MSTSAWLAVAALSILATGHARAAPDVSRGEELYNRCVACHSLRADRVGPRHCGLFGRRAGTVPGFDYSPAMASSNIVWDEKTLDRFLAAPLEAVPGTTMTYAGVAEAKDRADLISFLKHANTAGECLRGLASAAR